MVFHRSITIIKMLKWKGLILSVFGVNGTCERSACGIGVL